MATPEELDKLKELVEYLARRLVAEPEQIQVFTSDLEEDTLELEVAPDDVGKIIGKQGKMIRALRLVVSAAAAKLDTRVGLEVLESDPES